MFKASRPIDEVTFRHPGNPELTRAVADLNVNNEAKPEPLEEVKEEAIPPIKNTQPQYISISKI